MWAGWVDQGGSVLPVLASRTRAIRNSGKGHAGRINRESRTSCLSTATQHVMLWTLLLDYGGCSELQASLQQPSTPPRRQGLANRPGRDRIHARVCSGIWDRGIEIRRWRQNRYGSEFSQSWSLTDAAVGPCTCRSDQPKCYVQYIYTSSRGLRPVPGSSPCDPASGSWGRGSDGGRDPGEAEELIRTTNKSTAFGGEKRRNVWRRAQGSRRPALQGGERWWRRRAERRSVGVFVASKASSIRCGGLH